MAIRYTPVGTVYKREKYFPANIKLAIIGARSYMRAYASLSAWFCQLISQTGLGAMHKYP